MAYCLARELIFVKDNSKFRFKLLPGLSDEIATINLKDVLNSFIIKIALRAVSTLVTSFCIDRPAFEQKSGGEEGRGDKIQRGRRSLQRPLGSR